MPESQRKQAPSAPMPEPEPSEQTIRVYSDYAGMTSTTEEFVLRFGQRDLKDSNKVIEVVRVYLSLPHAKRLVTAMARTLKAYEEVFGEIVTEPFQALSDEQKRKLGLDKTKQ